MKKYGEKLIKDYIEGNDIEEYSIEELENDSEFMIMVINKTNDKNIYNLCGDDVKKDPRFVKYLITKFNYDTNFILSITDYYFKHEHNDEDEMDILILICEYIKNKDEENYILYGMIKHAKYVTKKVEIEALKNEKENWLDDKLFEMSGMGFLLIQEHYQNNPMSIKYFAKKFLEEILDKNRNYLEKLIHDDFSSSEELEKKGPKNYLISLINKEDISLASYAIVHISLLEPYMITIKKIIKNWEIYLEKQEKEQYEIMIEEVHKYMSERYSAKITEDEILYVVSKEFGIEDKVQKYATFSDDIYYIKNRVNYRIKNFMIDINNDIDVLTVEKIMLTQLKDYIELTEEQKSNPKILKLLKIKKDPV